jgi:hypothetical protein
MPPQQPLKCPGLTQGASGGVSPNRTSKYHFVRWIADPRGRPASRMGTSATVPRALAGLGMGRPPCSPLGHRRRCNARCGGYDRTRCPNGTTSDPLAI